MPSAHCVATLEGVILSVDNNFLTLVGRPESHIIGRSYKDITEAGDLAKSAGMLQSLVVKAPPTRLQKHYVRPDGRVVLANVLTSRFADPDQLISTIYWSETGKYLPPLMLWETALGIKHVQRVRREQFGSECFSDGVDSILLELYLSEAEGRVLTDHDLVNLSPSPPSTTTRWLRHLLSKGIIQRTDERACDVSFTDLGIAKMEKMLASVSQLPDAVSKLN